MDTGAELRRRESEASRACRAVLLRKEEGRPAAWLRFLRLRLSSQTSAVRTAELLLKSLKDTRLDGPKTSSFRAAQSIGNYSVLYSSSAH